LDRFPLHIGFLAFLRRYVAGIEVPTGNSVPVALAGMKDTWLNLNTRF